MSTSLPEVLVSTDCDRDQHDWCSGGWGNAAGARTRCECRCHPERPQIPHEAAVRIREAVLAEVRSMSQPIRRAGEPRPIVTGGWDPGAARAARPVDIEYVACWVTAGLLALALVLIKAGLL